MLWELFWTFARMGVLTYGGGYAMLPILQKEVVEKKQWATEEEVLDYFALGQCTPGIIAVNTATFIGQKLAGSLGGIVATLGVVFPSVVIITVIAACLNQFAHYPVVQHAFGGIRVSVLIMILDAVLRVGKKAVKDRFSRVIFLAVAIGMILCELFAVDISPVWFVILSAIFGILYQSGRVKK